MSVSVKCRAILSLALAISLVGCSDASTRSTIDLEKFAEYQDEWTVQHGIVVATDDICTESVPCVQAIRGNHFSVLKFRTLRDAEEHVESLGDEGHQIDPLVIEFTAGELSSAEREDVIYTFSNLNASSAD